MASEYESRARSYLASLKKSFPAHLCSSAFLPSSSLKSLSVGIAGPIIFFNSSILGGIFSSSLAALSSSFGVASAVLAASTYMGPSY